MTQSLKFSGIFDKAQPEQEEPEENDIDWDDSDSELVQPGYVLHLLKGFFSAINNFNVLFYSQEDPNLNDGR